MRFAWLRQHSDDNVSIRQGLTHPLAMLRIAYNAAFWIFLIPFLFTAVDYGTGFIAFTVVILVRLGANLLTNNLLAFSPAQYESYPFRIP